MFRRERYEDVDFETPPGVPKVFEMFRDLHGTYKTRGRERIHGEKLNPKTKMRNCKRISVREESHEVRLRGRRKCGRSLVGSRELRREWCLQGQKENRDCWVRGVLT